jgi:hypothetical protein
MKNYPALPDDYVPVNLDDAILFFLSRLDAASREQMEKWDEDTWLARTHHTAGRHMRNAWNLWGLKQGECHALRDWFNALGIKHADDMSGIILRSIHRKAKNTEIQLDAQVDYYKKFWSERECETQ